MIESGGGGGEVRKGTQAAVRSEGDRCLSKKQKKQQQKKKKEERKKTPIQEKHRKHQ